MGRIRKDWDSTGYAFQSGQTVKRWAEPSSPREAKVMTQFVADYSNQSSHMPAGGLVVSTQLQGRKTRSINKSGRSAVLGAIGESSLDRMGDQPGKF